jgi:gamma-glutamyltranspeptidase/glutathione hydrolase
MLRSRVLACATSLLMLSACSVDLAGSLGVGGGASGARTVGLVVGDEPFAVRAGAAILAQGGSAVDAVTATYFTLAVTYPVAAGLGGGGICIVHDATTGQNEEFDFLARDASGGGNYAVPGSVRGFALMQSLYGAVPWQRDVSPGEGYAAAGFPISRALSLQLVQSQEALHADAGLAAEFLDDGGKVKPEGTVVSSPQLAQTLAAVRVRGLEGLYKGEVAARIIAFTQSQGGGITVADFGANTASRGAPQALRMGNALVLLPSQRVGAGAFAGSLFESLNQAQSTNAGAGDLQASIVYAVKQALAKFGVNNVPANLGATGFAAVDARGEAAACAVTMNGPFGSARSATGTGVVLARAPGSGPAGVASAFLTPVIALEGEGGSVALAGVGAGGPNGAAALGYALARVAKGQTPANSADIRSTGVANDTVNVIACQSAMCVALPDPAGHGLGAAGDAGQ